MLEALAKQVFQKTGSRLCRALAKILRCDQSSVKKRPNGERSADKQRSLLARTVLSFSDFCTLLLFVYYVFSPFAKT